MSYADQAAYAVTVICKKCAATAGNGCKSDKGWPCGYHSVRVKDGLAIAGVTVLKKKRIYTSRWKKRSDFGRVPVPMHVAAPKEKRDYNQRQAMRGIAIKFKDGTCALFNFDAQAVTAVWTLNERPDAWAVLRPSLWGGNAL